MAKHEESHLATGELKNLPDCSDLVRRAVEALEKDKRESNQLENESQMSEDWRTRFSELLFEKKLIQVPENLLKRLEISVLRNGEPITVQEFESSRQIWTEDREATS